MTFADFWDWGWRFVWFVGLVIVIFGWLILRAWWRDRHAPDDEN